MTWMTKDWTSGQLNALVKNVGGEEIARAIIAGKAKITVVIMSLLELVTTVEVAAQLNFVASDHFKVDLSDKAEVKIAYLWNFDSFLRTGEGAVPKSVLSIRKLTEAALDKQIRGEIGAEKEETTLSQLWALLRKQDHGQKGDLLTNGYANIFYIRDAEGTLSAVLANWRAVSDGWYVNADSVADPYGWGADSQVVSRN